MKKLLAAVAALTVLIGIPTSAQACMRRTVYLTHVQASTRL